MSLWEEDLGLDVRNPRGRDGRVQPFLVVEGHFLLFMHLEVLRKGKCNQTENNWIPAANLR